MRAEGKAMRQAALKTRDTSMAMREEFEASGAWLFRWRSYLPLLLLALLLWVVYSVPRPFAAFINQTLWDMLCLFVALLGMAVRVATIGCTPRRTSGRNTQHQVADTLNVTGMYSIVRHPLYLGNLIIVLGIASYAQLWWMTLLTLLAFTLYYERIMFAEEAFLRNKFGATYEQWAATTPAWVPRLRQWRAGSLRFSLRNVLKREYNGTFAIFAVLAVLNAVMTLSMNKPLQLNSLWTQLLIAAAAVWVVLRCLKRYTRVLGVTGR